MKIVGDTPSKGKKTALVCGGGGFTGGVYEVGCLRALESFFPDDFSVNDFDIFVGVSAGSLIASSLANLFSVDDLFKSLLGSSTELDPFTRSVIYQFNVSEIAKRTLLFPKRLYDTLNLYAKSGDDLTLLDAMLTLSENLPSGLLTSKGLERYCRKNFSKRGHTNRFSQLKRELYISSVNLDTCERVVFGEKGYRHIPISMAVQASTSLPIAYKPTRIGDDVFIDGSVEKNFHLDVAIDHGAELIVCINPLVPILNDPRSPMIPLLSGRTGYLSEKGLVHVIDQAFRIMIHKRLEYGVQIIKESYPDVDIILIEPDRKDFTMFFYNIFRYSARVIIAEHGFSSLMQMIDSNFDEYRRVFGKYGIDLNREVVSQEYEEMARDKFSLASIVNTLGRMNPFKKRSAEDEELNKSNSKHGKNLKMIKGGK